MQYISEKKRKKKREKENWSAYWINLSSLLTGRLINHSDF